MYKSATQHEERVSPRVQKLRKQKRKQHIIVWSVVFIVLCILVGVFMWGTHTETLRVRDIVVEGTQNVSPKTIRAAVEARVADGRFSLINKNSTLFFPKEQVASALYAQFPRIHTAVVSPQIATRDVHIRVSEREPFAVWCAPLGDTEDARECFYIDEAGVVFERAHEPYELLVVEGSTVPSEIYPQSEPFLRTVEPEHFKNMNAFIALLTENGFHPQQVVFDGADITIALMGGYDIRADITRAGEDSMIALLSILSQKELADARAQLLYIDIRFGERVYYKLRESE